MLKNEPYLELKEGIETEDFILGGVPNVGDGIVASSGQPYGPMRRIYIKS